MVEVETRNVEGRPTAIGSAGPFTAIFDRPVEGGGEASGSTEGNSSTSRSPAVISNDLFREARAEGISLSDVRVTVRGDFSGDPAVSEEIEYDVANDGEAPPEELRAPVERVDRIAEIPNSLRAGTPVRLASTVTGS